MPEGDTIHALANRVRPVLVGRTLRETRLPRSPVPPPAAGVGVSAVEARGKHLLVHLDDGHVVHVHLGMTGEARIVASGRARRRPPPELSVALLADDIAVVITRAPVAELLDEDALARHPRLRELGPDLTVDAVDLDAAVARMRRFAITGQTIGEALLDQRAAAGIGNVYRSEVCFLERLDPRTPVEDVDDATRRALLATASRLLVANVVTSRRTTVPDAAPGTLWVYDRGGRPCRRCNTAIAAAQLGAPPRITYWCPTCQA